MTKKTQEPIKENQEEYENNGFEEIDDEIIFANVDRINAETDSIALRSKQDGDQIDINKAEELRLLLNSIIVDESKYMPGSEQQYRTMITGKNRDIILDKLIEIVKRF